MLGFQKCCLHSYNYVVKQINSRFLLILSFYVSILSNYLGVEIPNLPYLHNKLTFLEKGVTLVANKRQT